MQKGKLQERGILAEVTAVLLDCYDLGNTCMEVAERVDKPK